MNYAKAYPRFWLSYFVASTILVLANSIVSIVGNSKQGPIGVILGIGFGVVGLFPLYGYVRQRRVNPKWLWFAVFLVSAIASAAVLAIATQVAIANGSPTPLVIAVPLLLLGFPYLFALHQYLYRSPDLWR